MGGKNSPWGTERPLWTYAMTLCLRAYSQRKPWNQGALIKSTALSRVEGSTPEFVQCITGLPLEEISEL